MTTKTTAHIYLFLPRDKYKNMIKQKNGTQIMLTAIIMSALLQATACTSDLGKQDSGKDQPFINGNIAENTFIESNEAFSNPLKGFITKNALNPYTTLARMDIRWNEIETSKNDGPEKIKEYSDYNFIPFERRGIKIIARVIGCWPQAEYAEGRVQSVYGRWCDVYWPDDLKMGNMSIANYATDEFKTRAATLIRKMGEVWDNDPRIAFIHMGIVGYWGEQNSPSVADVPGLEKIMGDACVEAFKNKCVARRYHEAFKDYSFGIYYDSFGHADTDDWKYMIEMGDYWKKQAVTGEVAYDWGNYQIQPGSSPTESLSDPEHLDYLISMVRKTHTTGLSWIAEYDTSNEKAAAGAKEFQKVMGYRFFIPWAQFTPTVISDNHELEVRLAVVNTGSAPLYARYDLKLHLLSEEDRSVVWTGNFEDVDCRDWMPGDNWSDETGCYTESAAENILYGKWIIPEELSDGEYLLAVSLDDMSTGSPSVRFAQDNYFSGGYTVIGKTGVGIQPSANSISGVEFDRLSTERLK